MLSLIPAILAAAAAQPGALKTFQDWTVGCDNGRACQAVALLPENGDEDYATLVLTRGPGANDAPEISIRTSGNGLRLDLGGRAILLRPRGEDEQLVAPSDALAVIAAMRVMDALSVRDAAGKRVAIVSVKGASAALLYIDDQQKRVGAVTALVRPGPKPASAVPPPPPLPVVRQAAPSSAPPPRLNLRALIKANADTSCDRIAAPQDVTVARLDAAATLVLIPDYCLSGAYNMASVPLVADNAGRTRPAPVDNLDRAKEGDMFGFNAGWDAKSRRLGTYSKGRGLGDCGVAQDYVWDGSRFRIVEQLEMGECRGSIDWIPTWRADVR